MTMIKKFRAWREAQKAKAEAKRTEQILALYKADVKRYLQIGNLLNLLKDK